MSINTKKGPHFDSGLCRCCGVTKKCRLLNIEYEWQGQKEIYSDMFVDCFALVLSHLDGEVTDRLICATCVSRLREAYAFRHQVLQCEEKLLRTRMHEEAADTAVQTKEETNVKMEIEIDEQECNGDDYLENNDDDIDIKEEPIVRPKKTKHNRKLLMLKAKKRKTIKKDDILRNRLLFGAPTGARLKRMQDIDSSEKNSQQGKNAIKTNDNIKTNENMVTIVENSYALPFDTSYSDFFCVYCRQVFTDAVKLREHTMTHDPNTYKSILTEQPQTKKLQIDIFRIDCRLCPEPISDLDKFQQHVTNVHQKNYHENESDFLKFRLTPNPLSCIECGATFTFFHAVKKHMAKHFGTSICDICGAHYFNERMLAIHQKTHQTKIEERFTCKECGKSFKTKYTRYVHIARAHKKESVYQCRKCDEEFFSYTLRYRHMIDVHGEERTFKCEQCDRAYDSRKSLREHNRRFHLKILKHQCDLCDKRFYLPSRLREHIEASHTGERNYRCEYCGKSYPRLRGLKVHMQSHSNDKKFKCDLCNASFTQNVNLKNHMKRQHQNMELEENNYHENNV